MRDSFRFIITRDRHKNPNFDAYSGIMTVQHFDINALGTSCRVTIGEKIARLRDYIPDNTVVITDNNVHRIYGRFWNGFPTLIIGTGEQEKSMDTVARLCRQLLDLQTDRSGFIVGVGGGVVCDVTGFVASVFMRGLRFGFVPTSLLAQADAAIGGKNGVNLDGYKNIIGTFSLPEFILSDPEVLTTLPEAEISNGFAEIVKHALIADHDLFGYIEDHADKIRQLHPEVINHLLMRSAAIKSEIVALDSREHGQRRLLNFGHTFGHAFENVGGLPHGAAVSVGMMIAARYSAKRSLLTSGQVERIGDLLRRLGLPVGISLPADEVLRAIQTDKKREQSHLHFVMLRDIGSGIVEKLSLEEIKSILAPS